MSNINKSRFDKLGYIIIDQIISDDLIDGIIKSLLTLLNKYQPKLFSDEFSSDILTNDEFNKKLIQFRSNHPDVFGAIYDSLQSCISTKKIASQDKISDVLASLTGKIKESFVCCDHSIRIDGPNDKRNKLDWHTDIYAGDLNHSRLGGFTVWCPLHDVNPESGSLTICVGSHKDNVIQNIEVNKANVSNKYMINNEDVKKFDILKTTIKKGTAIISPMNLVHKSGDNLTNNFRFTFVARYYCVSYNDYLPGYNEFKLSKIVKEKISSRKYR